jgi:hypothetical protein
VAREERGAKLGGWTAGSQASKRQADELAERMRPILTEAHLRSARQIAAELNRRGIKSATGGEWSSKTVDRLQKRLGLSGYASAMSLLAGQADLLVRDEGVAGSNPATPTKQLQQLSVSRP